MKRPEKMMQDYKETIVPQIQRDRKVARVASKVY